VETRVTDEHDFLCTCDECLGPGVPAAPTRVTAIEEPEHVGPARSLRVSRERETWGRRRIGGKNKATLLPGAE
jgi:hypothetical protein